MCRTEVQGKATRFVVCFNRTGGDRLRLDCLWLWWRVVVDQQAT